MLQPSASSESLELTAVCRLVQDIIAERRATDEDFDQDEDEVQAACDTPASGGPPSMEMGSQQKVKKDHRRSLHGGLETRPRCS